MTGEHGRYEVVGPREYLGVKPGGVFVAQLDPGMEARAVARGDIRLLERVVPCIDPARATYRSWPE